MTKPSDQEVNEKFRGFGIAIMGLLVAMIGGALAFLDPSTGDGGSGGFLFKAGFALAVLGILIGILGSVLHFVRVFERRE